MLWMFQADAQLLSSKISRKLKLLVRLYTKIFPFPTFISPDALRVIERITEILKRIPEFALIITSESAEVFSSSLSSQHIPWFITKAGSYVVTAGMCHMSPHVITVS